MFCLNVIAALVLLSGIRASFLDETRVSELIKEKYGGYTTTISLASVLFNGPKNASKTEKVCKKVFKQIAKRDKVITADLLVKFLHTAESARNRSDEALSDVARLKITEIAGGNVSATDITERQFVNFMSKMLYENVTTYPAVCKVSASFMNSCHLKYAYETRAGSGWNKLMMQFKQLVYIRPRVIAVEQNCNIGLNAFNGYRVETCVLEQSDYGRLESSTSSCFQALKCFMSESELSAFHKLCQSDDTKCLAPVSRNMVYDLPDAAFIGTYLKSYYGTRYFVELIKTNAVSSVVSFAATLGVMLMCPLCASFATVGEFALLNFVPGSLGFLSALPFFNKFQHASAMNQASILEFT